MRLACRVFENRLNRSERETLGEKQQWLVSNLLGTESESEVSLSLNFISHFPIPKFNRSSRVSIIRNTRRGGGGGSINLQEEERVTTDAL